MFPHVLAFFFFLPAISVQALSDPSREARRADLIGQLNEQFNCKILMFNAAEQVTYGREISLPECKPSSGENYVKAGQVLKQLAEISQPVDAEVLHEQSQAFQEMGAQAVSLEQIRAKLIEDGVLQERGGEWRVEQVGHPFQSADYTRWFEAYMTAVAKIGRHISSDPQNPLSGCMEPICDPALFRVAEALTARPPLDAIYYADERQPVAPHPYALSYFSERYSRDREIRRALGLQGTQAWPWRVGNYNAHINDSGDLVFTELFTPESKIFLSVADWQNRKEFPFVVPLFMLFQEASDVLDLVRSVENNYVAERIREIRFESANEGSPLLELGKYPGGEYILRIRVLNSQGDVSSIRTLLHSRIPLFLKSTAQVARQE